MRPSDDLPSLRYPTRNGLSLGSRERQSVTPQKLRMRRTRNLEPMPMKTLRAQLDALTAVTSGRVHVERVRVEYSDALATALATGHGPSVVARALGVSRWTVYRHAEGGDPARLFIDLADVVAARDAWREALAGRPKLAADAVAVPGVHSR